MNRGRWIISIGIMLVSTGLLVWGVIPAKREVLVRSILPLEMRVPGGGQGGGEAVLQTRQVVVERPSSMRIGDAAEISLVFEPAQDPAGMESGQAGLTNAYDHYNLMAEGRFEVAGMMVDPAVTMRESLLEGQTVRLKWSVLAREAGSYKGNLWLELRFLLLDGSQALQTPVFVQDIELHATRGLGLSGPMARLAGGLGIVISLAMSADILIRGIKKKFASGTKDSVEV